MNIMKMRRLTPTRKCLILKNYEYKKIHLLTVVGTRPEIIRLSSIINRLNNSKSIKHTLVHTGQNYDYNLNEVFLKI